MTPWLQTTRRVIFVQRSWPCGHIPTDELCLYSDHDNMARDIKMGYIYTVIKTMWQQTRRCAIFVQWSNNMVTDQKMGYICTAIMTTWPQTKDRSHLYSDQDNMARNQKMGFICTVIKSMQPQTKRWVIFVQWSWSHGHRPTDGSHLHSDLDHMVLFSSLCCPWDATIHLRLHIQTCFDCCKAVHEIWNPCNCLIFASLYVCFSQKVSVQQLFTATLWHLALPCPVSDFKGALFISFVLLRHAVPTLWNTKLY